MAESEHLVIRNATHADSAALSVLLEELGYAREDAFVREKLKRLSLGQGDRIFVAEIRGRVVGFASCHVMPLIHEQDDLCRITSIIVEHAHRRQKIGFQLMNAIEKYAKVAGCSRVEVTSGEFRHDAHIFYERIGYRAVSRRFLKDIEK